MKLRRFERKIEIFGKLIKMIYEIAPIFTCSIFFVGILQSVSRVVVLLQTQKLFESISELAKQNNSIKIVVFNAVILCIIMIISQLLNGTQNFLYDIFILKMNMGLGKKLNEKLSNLPPLFFEDAANLDFLDKVKYGKDASIDAILAIGDIFTYYLPYFVLVEIYLFFIQKKFAIFIVLILGPVLITQIIRSKFYGNLEEKAAPLRRKMEHYGKCISDIKYAKETIILGAVSFFTKKYKKVLNQWDKEVTSIGIKCALIEFFFSILTLIGYITVIIILCRSLVYKEISAAEFVTIYSSISILFSTMEEVIQYSLNSLSENYTKLEIFFEFITRNINQEIINYDYSGGISLRHIDFKYPNSNKYVLKDINITIGPQESVAIVGENGSGKTTLIKIILGLYVPNSGTVLAPKNCSSETTAVFQDFQKYKTTVNDNVRISDVFSINDELPSLVKAGNDEYVLSIRDKSLGVEFGGIDLSGGQWQRIAIARAVYRKYNFIALDEPTSAIDALEEDFLYANFKQIISGKTSVIITHRLGFIKNVDKIIVLKEGEVIEQGTHEELMRKRQYYFDLYISQAENYS